MLDKSCKEFVSVLSSKAPVPGGGGACAYVGAIGMALGSMVGNLTLGKKKYADVQEDILCLLEESDKIIKELERLVDEDAKAFYPLSQAYGLPSSTDEEKIKKQEVLQKALEGACLVPLKITWTCYKALELLEQFREKGTIIAISDVGVGAKLCEGAIMGAKLNVLINVKLMKDESLKRKFTMEIDDIVKMSLEKSQKIFEEVENQLMN